MASVADAEGGTDFINLDASKHDAGSEAEGMELLVLLRYESS
jgi:hypothetical protein